MMRKLGWVCGATVLLLAWWLGSEGKLPMLFPGPADTLRQVGELFRTGAVWAPLGLTLGRSLAASLLAIVAGTLVGVMAAGHPWLAGFLQPFRQLATGIPPIVVIVVAVLWWGSSPWVAIIICAIVMFPMVAAATEGALRDVDGDLVTVLRAHRVHWWWQLRRLYIPAVLPMVLVVSVTTVSTSVRIMLMAELLAAGTGVGGAIAYASTVVRTVDIFAWTIVVVAAAALVEWGLRRGLRRLLYVVGGAGNALEGGNIADGAGR